MIPKETIDKIFEAARIEEVVGGFIQLKKEERILLGIVLFMMRKHHHLQFLLAKVFTNVLVVEKGEIA